VAPQAPSVGQILLVERALAPLGATVPLATAAAVVKAMSAAMPWTAARLATAAV